jgi:hypothetical protein
MAVDVQVKPQNVDTDQVRIIVDWWGRGEVNMGRITMRLVLAVSVLHSLIGLSGRSHSI